MISSVIFQTHYQIYSEKSVKKVIKMCNICRCTFICTYIRFPQKNKLKKFGHVDVVDTITTKKTSRNIEIAFEEISERFVRKDIK